MCKGFLISILFAIVALPAAYAVEPSERLEDPVLEARAREISQGLRCLVCQNQSIDDSNAGLARDLRILVRERLLAGDTNAETKAFIVARYGDYVLMRPPFKSTTYILWGTPLLVLLLAFFTAWRWYRHRPVAVADETVSDREREALDRLLAGDEDA